MTMMLVWMHIVAAVTWIGGMVFLSLVLMPEFRRAGLAGERMLLFGGVARRFRVVVWLAMTVLVGTGAVLLEERGLALTDPLSWPRVFQIKLTLVACLVGLSLLHDLLLGPLRVKGDTATGKKSVGPIAQSVSRLVPRVALLLALAVVFAAVVFVRS